MGGAGRKAQDIVEAPLPPFITISAAFTLEPGVASTHGAIFDIFASRILATKGLCVSAFVDVNTHGTLARFKNCLS